MKNKADSDSFFQASLDQVKKLVLQALKDEDITIILFGSAARGDTHRHSDIDIAIIPKNGYNRKKLILLKERLENMNIPYTVDLVDISEVSPVFREQVLKEGKIWKS